MTQRVILAALAVVALSGPATAQGGPPAFPPYEVMTVVRSTGLEPLGQPVRRGPNYVLHAVDGRDREVRVVVDARSGRILSVAPIATASRMAPGVTMGPYERMPPGYVPRGAYPADPAFADDDDDDVIYNDARAPRPPSVVPNVPPRSSNAAPPRVIGPNTPDDADRPPPSEPHVITSIEPDQNGMLPPPPERFPQRATQPAVKPKPPVKRAAAALPRQAPLPKPKPQVEASSPPESAPALAPESKPDENALPN